MAKGTYRKAPLMFGLEPRLMFDGAIANAATKAAKAAPAVLPVQVRAADPSQDAGKKEVVFVDSSLSNWQALVAGIKPGVEVDVIDGTQGGLAQIANWASTHSGYDSVHILSSGG